MGDADINTEAIHSALKSIRVLRSSVVEIFNFLDEGATAAHDDEERDKFVNEAQQKLNAVRSRMRELETACTLIESPNVPLNLGNSGLLSQDPAYENTPLYNDVVNSYQWFDKLHEYSSHACAILTQNSLRRTYNSPLSPNSPYASRPQNTGHNAPAQTVDAVISQFNNVFPDMQIQISRPYGAPTVLLITLGRTLKAIVILRGLLIEWVVVRGYDEDFYDASEVRKVFPEELGLPMFGNTFPREMDDPFYMTDGHGAGSAEVDSHYRAGFSQSTLSYPFSLRDVNAAILLNQKMDAYLQENRKLDLWSQSSHLLFQKVTDHANAAMLHFYSPHLPDLAVRSFLTWLRSYNNLFTASCRKCGNRLLDNMPPTWRDLRNLDVYHEACKP